MAMLRAAARLVRRATDALFPADERGCHGCSLDVQWVGSELADHSCERWKR